MSNKFCADDAKKLTRESIGFELEDRDSNFAWILNQIKDSASEGADSLEITHTDLFTIESVCELSNRGFTLVWVADMNPLRNPSIRIIWEEEGDE